MNGRVIVLGGENGYNQPQTTIFAYDPPTDQWSQIGSLPSIRSTGTVRSE